MADERKRDRADEEAQRHCGQFRTAHRLVTSPGSGIQHTRACQMVRAAPNERHHTGRLTSRTSTYVRRKPNFSFTVTIAGLPDDVERRRTPCSRAQRTQRALSAVAMPEPRYSART